MPSPLVEVKDGAGAYASAVGGVNVTPGNTITIHLIDSSADSWSIQCLTTDELSVAATVNAGLTINTLARTATFTAPVAGRAYRFQSRVNNGIGPDGKTVTSYTTTFCIYTRTAASRRVHAADETVESNATFGWIGDLNDIIRNPTSGGTPGGASGTVQYNNAATLGGISIMTTDGSTYVALGATPATAGGFRFGNAIEGWSRNAGNSANFRLFGVDSSNVANYGDEVSGYGSVTISHANAGLKLKYWNGSTFKAHVTLDGTSILSASPRLGDSTPYASEGRTSIATDGNVTLSAAQYARHVINCTGTLTAQRTWTFPHPASEDASYTKAITHNGATNSLVISTGTGTTVTVAVAAKALLAFTPSGVQSVGSFQVA